MLERREILKHMNQLFSPEYQWSVGGVTTLGKRLLMVQEQGRSADMLIDAEVTQTDLYYAGHSLIDKLCKTGEEVIE